MADGMVSAFRHAFADSWVPRLEHSLLNANLEHHGETNRDFAYDIGLEAGGRMKNLRGCIHELCEENWAIKTDTRGGVCFYVLVIRPKAEQVAVWSSTVVSSHLCPATRLRYQPADSARKVRYRGICAGARLHLLLQ